MPIGAWVFGEACRQLARWGGARSAAAVAEHARQRVEPPAGRTGDGRGVPSWPPRSAGVSPSSFVIEIAEGVLVADTPGTARVLAELARLGARVALDDFGTAYASLTFLRRFPVHALKIDQSFVEGCGSRARGHSDRASGDQPRPRARARGDRGGVETDHQLAALRELGCDSVQGYVIAPPAPADEATDLLLNRLDGETRPDR